MNWRTIAASEIGTAHLVNGTRCEDRCLTLVDKTAAKIPVLTMLVADGAGSAVKGGDGAEYAIEAAASFIRDQLQLPEFAINDDLAVAIVMAVRDRIFQQAESIGMKARDFACTFLGLVSAPYATLVFQVGDGGVVVDVGAGLEVPVVPMSGEYANMTHFVIDDDAVQILATRVYGSPALKAAVFSDGLQRLALNLTTNTAHEPFFSSFFDVLSSAEHNQEDQLRAALVRFLGSPAVNERTDDDKTLALAVVVS